MSNILILAGSSCPALAGSICSRLGTNSAPVELSQFANGETSVKILTSIREKDVFVVQSGSSKINDSIMELLILISACKGGSADKITAVLPYFPYSRQSKKKSHRGSITARMLANLLSVAGVHHVVTVDLHASQMQGFFKCPIDNLHAEPLISKWIRHNVINWHEAVCISKNAGGTKRVTSLADALKLNFGMITTHKKRDSSKKGKNPVALQKDNQLNKSRYNFVEEKSAQNQSQIRRNVEIDSTQFSLDKSSFKKTQSLKKDCQVNPEHNKKVDKSPNHYPHGASQILKSKTVSMSGSSGKDLEVKSGLNDPKKSLLRTMSSPAITTPVEDDFEFKYERARDVIQGRLIYGHIVPDDYPPLSPASASTDFERLTGNLSEVTHIPYIKGQAKSLDKIEGAEVTTDEEEDNFKNDQFEHMITLVGDVCNRTVFIVDDMIDKSGSWIAAAECVVKRGGANKVYCIATHGLFGGDSLEELQDCDCIDTIVVTNSFPIPTERACATSKLVILDLSNLLSEAIRRNHYGESMCALFTHSND